MKRRLFVVTVSVILIATRATASDRHEQVTDHGRLPVSPFTVGVVSSGWIPFEVFRKTRIFIPAEVNGVATLVMLDSGASETVIDTKYINKLRLKETGHLTGRGAEGSAAYTVLHGVSIKLGAIFFRNVASVGINLSAVEKQVGHDLPVIIGGDIFARSVVDIDFAQHRIAFRDPAAFKPPLVAMAVPVSRAGENFAIQATVEGRPAKLVFDIGNASPLNLYAEFWDRTEFARSRAISTTKSGGLGGMHVYRLATVKTIKVGGAMFRQFSKR